MNNQNDIYRELPDYLTDGVYFTDFVAIIANAGEKELIEVGERMRTLVEHSMLMHRNTFLSLCPLEARKLLPTIPLKA